jgi:ATP-dependent Clp protease adaptor protein ClpS
MAHTPESIWMIDTVFDTTTKTKLRRPSMWTVRFVNDDYTPMEFVVKVLINVFNQSAEDAHRLMLAVHNAGVANVGSYTFEVASHKTDQTMLLAAVSQHPLLVYPAQLE